jgi:hypothetical protein
MLRHPVIVSTLEEDLKKLGLLSEEGQPSAPQTPAPAGEPASNKASPSRNVGAMSDDPDEDGKDETDEAPNHQGEPQPAANLPTTPGAQSENIAGMPDPIRGAGGKKKAAITSASAVENDEPDEKDEEVLQGASAVMEAIAKTRGLKPRHKAQESAPVSRAASLIEEVNAIMESIDDSHRNEAVKAFANVGIIAEMLHMGFAEFAEAYEDEDLGATSAALSELSENAADIAAALEEGEEIEREALETEFRAQMEALVNGLDLYSDVVESDAELAEGEDEDDDDDDDDDKKSKKDKDDKDDKDDDGEEDGDKDEAILPRSPLVNRDNSGTRPTTGARGAIARGGIGRGGIVSSKTMENKTEAWLPFGKGKAQKK